MNAKDLLWALNDVKEDFIEAASPDQIKGRPPWKTWGALAACLTALLLGAIWSLPGEAPPSPADTPPPPVEPTPWVPCLIDGLPQIHMDTAWDSGDMGFEGIMVKDAAELDQNTPWKPGDALETLPVFRNKSYLDPGGTPISDQTEEDLLAQAQDAAEALGLTITKYTPHRAPDSYHDQPETLYLTHIDAATELGTITVYANGDLRMEWEEPAPLDKKLDLNDPDRVAGALAQQYADLLGYTAPTVSIFQDHTYEGEQDTRLSAYDGSGTLTDQILSCFFSSARFALKDQGLWLLDKDNALSQAEKLGDYPILSLDEATARLLEGRYFTTVPLNGLPEEVNIGLVELVYRNQNTVETFLPYYRFLVEIPETTPEETAALGLTTYGAYYVPAVEEKYLAGLEPGTGLWRWQ